MNTAVIQKPKSSVRPPIVVVMGHIDHGKTTILDHYRKTKIAEKESGGITQHIGAYEIEHHGRSITFIDTPGHEAFTKLRSRGATVADIAVLVIAAEEGMKPQTKEAIKIIQENELPFVVAINKIDKPEANPERVKQQLAEESILVESYGGKIPSVEISAKKGTRMDDLLEMILLLADIEQLAADPARPAEGIVIEVNRDPRRGNTATLLIHNGTLRRGDTIAIGDCVDMCKILENFRGQAAEALGPSSPAIAAGLCALPNVGEPFRVFPSKKDAAVHVAKFLKEMGALAKATVQAIASTADEKRVIFNIILKTDVTGSQEALEDSLRKLSSNDVVLNILKNELGDINESDAKLATATKLVTIVGFKVKVNSEAREFAEKAGVDIITGDVIYDLIDTVKHHIIQMLPPEVKRTPLGKIKTLKIFKTEGTKQIIGGRVEEGMVRRGEMAEIKRGKEVVGRGPIIQLQREKAAVEEISKGWECGIAIDSPIAIREGDVIDVIHEEIIPRIL